MTNIDRNSKITLGLAITLGMIVFGGIFQFFVSINTLASKEFVESKIADKIEVIEAKIGPMHEDIKWIKERMINKEGK